MSGAVIVSQKCAMYIRARMCVYIYIYKEVVKKKKKKRAYKSPQPKKSTSFSDEVSLEHVCICSDSCKIIDHFFLPAIAFVFETVGLKT